MSKIQGGGRCIHLPAVKFLGCVRPIQRESFRLYNERDGRKLGKSGRIIVEGPGHCPLKLVQGVVGPVLRGG